MARDAAGVEKVEFQMRDLRAKAGTDKAESSGDIMQTKDQFGQTTVVVTRVVHPESQGQEVMPTKRIADRCQNCDPETNKGLHQLSLANP
ncbi:hypothetical protein [Pseudomonas sp. lyk4-R2A-10]|uniref:hypothetical protein n=1 Tax=Pseudomonas sp. lyk4-R2A-10 TaxID=3040315 RepID=UPI0025548FE0|nr:hypothetical protein [Pseudomonas sp. lyk4-R2A-10]